VEDSEEFRVDGEFCRSVLEAIPDPISVHADDGTLVYANSRLLDVYRKNLSELAGRPCVEANHSSESACPNLHEPPANTAAVGDRVSIGDKTFAVSVVVVADEPKGAKKYVRILRDVTADLRAEEQLVRTEKYATLGQIMLSMAHEVGTPLNIISGYAEYLLMRTNPTRPGHKELSTILEQSRRVAGFVRQLLDLVGPTQERSDAIGLQGFLDETIMLMRHHLRKADVEARLSCKVESPVIYGDARRLRQALINIILNASQRVGAGGKLVIVLDGTADLVKLVFAGAHRDGTDHDFSRLFGGYTDSGGQVRIVGMGLTLAREVLDQFGAKFETTNVAPGGTALVIYLPGRSGGTSKFSS
jgi:K+-sensing histidine kinase KdpD